MFPCGHHALGVRAGREWQPLKPKAKKPWVPRSTAPRGSASSTASSCCVCRAGRSLAQHLPSPVSVLVGSLAWGGLGVGGWVSLDLQNPVSSQDNQILLATGGSPGESLPERERGPAHQAVRGGMPGRGLLGRTPGCL